MDIRRPDLVAAGSLRGELGRDGDLVDFVVKRDHTGHLVLDISFGKP